MTVAGSATVAFATLGCKTNQFETAAMRERLEQAGYRVVPFAAGADLVIVNTCTVTAATDAQSRNLVRRARRLNPACRVVVTGCYAQVDPQALAELPGVELVIGNEEKRDLPALLTGSARERIRVADIRAREKAAIPVLTAFAERSRAFVQIQNGCDAFCSYCIIPHARGPSRSAPPEQVLDQVRQLVGQKVPEIVLTGIHVGNYGLDLQPRSSLLELLRRIEGETGVARLRLGSVEPTEIDAPLLACLAASKVICPHLHIPLQAGDDAVLARMRRPYGREAFRALIERVAALLPDAAIGLDVIAGFPGETDAEFENTVRLIGELPVSHLHVFPYSRRPGTAAAAMPGHLPGDVKKARAERLRALGTEKLATFAARFVGRVMEVVVEGGGKSGQLKGVTRNYLEVRFAGPAELVGQSAAVRVTAAVNGVLNGELAG
ncbi:MAG: tRNA (N(6)-L-threonylcarbamoyladenosine(37)-C(2))-methylthiotransferase MtaB [Deltaproteobacteria bacterium]|nr:MAG: tRNA (N(6)-L-threonylcarbamoyladenosine(37)-C(2))-methylthiotransferase MtaB [Deltaproteobacteria bacterium]